MDRMIVEGSTDLEPKMNYLVVAFGNMSPTKTDVC